MALRLAIIVDGSVGQHERAALAAQGPPSERLKKKLGRLLVVGDFAGGQKEVPGYL